MAGHWQGEREGHWWLVAPGSVDERELQETNFFLSLREARAVS